MDGKKLLIKVKKNIKLFIIGAALIMLLISDLGLIAMDQLFGEVKGVIFDYKIFDLILYSNLIVIGLVIIIYLLFLAIKYSKTVKNIARNIAISIVSIIIIIVLIELAFYLILKFNYKPFPYAYDSIDNNLFKRNYLLSHTGNKNVTSTWKKILVDPSKHDTSYIFNTIIKTDSLGNRLIDIPGMRDRKQYAIFFGCSYTFGVGVQDTETIPYYFAKNDTNFCAYNFACAGYGTQNMLVQLAYTNLKNHIKQDSGICFYIYMMGHPSRVIGDMRTYTTFGGDLPYYGYKNDSLYYYGYFSRNRWFISRIYTLLSKSHFVKYFNIDFPPKLKPEHYRLTCDIIYKSYLEYKKQFHNDNFYVVIYPAGGDIISYLKKYNIKVLDFSNLFDSSEKYYIPFDGHPTALAQKVLTENLINAINKVNMKH